MNKHKLRQYLLSAIYFGYMILGIWDLYYLDYQIYNEYFLTAMKYLHLPTFGLAYFWTDQFLRPIEPTKKIESRFKWIFTVMVWLTLYINSAGYVSFINRTFGTQTVEFLSGTVKNIEYGSSLFDIGQINLTISTEEGTDYLIIPASDLDNFTINEGFNLKMNSGCLGLKYIKK
jgi:hypothetical protein